MKSKNEVLKKHVSEYFKTSSYFSRSLAIYELLLKEANVKNFDEIGPDPFSLRNQSFPQFVNLDDPSITLEKIVKQFNLAETDLSQLDFDKKIDIQQKIPKIVHFIWLGTPLDYDYRTLETIKTWREKEPRLPIVVWTDMLTRSSTTEEYQKNKDALKWCRDNNIIMLSSKDIIMPKLSLRAHYLYERQRKNFGSSSDILRLYILKYFGGIYADTDTGLKKELSSVNAPEGMLLNFGKRLIKTLGFIREAPYGFFMNDLMMFERMHNNIDILLDAIEKRYQKSYKNLCDGINSKLQISIKEREDLYNSDNHRYNRNELDDQLKRLRMKQKTASKLLKIPPLNITEPRDLLEFLTMERTGPNIYDELHLYDKKADEIVIPVECFEFESRNSWLDRGMKRTWRDKGMEPTRLKDKGEYELLTELKQLLTDTLIELKFDPEKIETTQYIKKLSKTDYYTFVGCCMLFLLEYPDLTQNMIFFPSITRQRLADKYPSSDWNDIDDDLTKVVYQIIADNVANFPNIKNYSTMLTLPKDDHINENFAGATFKHLSFRGKNFTGANFQGAKFIHVNFDKSTLVNTCFDNAIFFPSRIFKDTLSFKRMLDIFDNYELDPESEINLRQSVLNDILARAHDKIILEAAYQHPYFSRHQDSWLREKISTSFRFFSIHSPVETPSQIQLKKKIEQLEMGDQKISHKS